MKRILIDYKKLPREVATLLIETYPDGYGDDDIIAFETAQGAYIETVELRTSDTLYLIKISKSLSRFIAGFEAQLEKELEIPAPAAPDNAPEEDLFEIGGEEDYGALTDQGK